MTPCHWGLLLKHFFIEVSHFLITTLTPIDLAALIHFGSKPVKYLPNYSRDKNCFVIRTVVVCMLYRYLLAVVTYWLELLSWDFKKNKKKNPSVFSPATFVKLNRFLEVEFVLKYTMAIPTKAIYRGTVNV